MVVAGLNIDGISLDGEQLSLIIYALDSMDVLEISECNLDSIGTCTFDICETDAKVYPDVLQNIPGVNVEQLYFHLFQSDSQWQFKTEFTYSLTKPIFEYNEISGPYYEPPCVRHLTFTKIILCTENKEHDITALLNDNAKKIIMKYCINYIEDELC